MLFYVKKERCAIKEGSGASPFFILLGVSLGKFQFRMILMRLYHW